MNPYAVKYSLGRAWGFAALSLGVWLVFWFHRTRRLLDREFARGRDDALLQSVALFVPVWNIFVLYWLYRDVDELRRWHGLPGLPVVAYTAGGALAPAVMYSIALGKVNEFWDVRTHGRALDAPVTGGEKAVLAVGAVLWLVWAAFIVLAIVVVIAAGD